MFRIIIITHDTLHLFVSFMSARMKEEEEEEEEEKEEEEEEEEEEKKKWLVNCKALCTS